MQTTRTARYLKMVLENNIQERKRGRGVSLPKLLLTGLPLGIDNLELFG